MAIKVSEQNSSRAQLLSVIMFAGGIAGALHYLLNYLFGLAHVSGHHGVVTRLDMHAGLCGLFAAVVWGSLWGLLFCFPLHKSKANFWIRSVLYGIPPAVVGSLIIPHHGILGTGLGFFTPIWVLLTSIFFWAVPAYLWIIACGFAQSTDGANEVLDVEGGNAPLIE